MASLKNIKLKIISVKKTSTVTRAMEAVSAVKMRKSQERALSSRLYAAAALSALERLAGSADLSRYPLMQSHSGKTLIIVVTSDKGLAGSLNSAVIKKAEAEIRERGLSVQDVVIIGIGRRGAEYFANRGYEVRLRHENVSDDVSESDVRSITDALLAAHESGEVGAAIVVYQNFISTFEQHPTARQIVPVLPQTMHDFVTGIRPARGKYAPAPSESESEATAPYTIEPDAETVLGVLLPKLLNIAVFHALLENKASEHSARMVAMKSATDNAKERAKQYTRLFNKIRQASITREISEITSGIEAMK
jgi:F-type H+-transporting ATPase subunit gamma